MVLLGLVEAIRLGSSGIELAVGDAGEIGGALDWRNISRLPLLMLIVVFLTSFGVAGLSLEAGALAGGVLPGFAAVPAAIANAALRYCPQAPMIDSLLRELGLDGSTPGLAGGGTKAITPTASAVASRGTPVATSRAMRAWRSESCRVSASRVAPAAADGDLQRVMRCAGRSTPARALVRSGQPWSRFLEPSWKSAFRNLPQESCRTASRRSRGVFGYQMSDRHHLACDLLYR